MLHTTNSYSIKDVSVNELLMSEMKLLQEEKDRLSKQVESLFAKIGHMREDYSSHVGQM